VRPRLRLAVLVAVAACRHEPQDEEAPTPAAVHCVPAARRSIELTATLRGRVAAPPGGELPVASQVAGRIDRILVHEGDRVTADTILAVVDESASRDAFRQADSALVQAKATEVNATATLERTKQLVARGIAAKQELDDATARADQARAGVAAATAAADLARRTLGRVQVRSTFDGVVTRVWRGPGALVDGTSATPVLQLAASSAAEFDVDATEGQILRIEPGQPASIALASGGEPLVGTVAARSTALDPTTGLGTVRITLEHAPLLTLGLFGTAVVHLGTREGAIVVPPEAMRGAVADGAEVVVCADGKADIRAVSVGWRDDKAVEVREGLREGERVAIDHVLGLQAGSPIVEAR
jgi:membrane fusion protein (multidrug efflux system)